MLKIPYATQWIDDADTKAVTEALRSDYLTQGPRVKEFEEKVARYCGAQYAVAVNSGTAALHIACLVAGIGPGDEAITSPITFVASANCIVYCGGRPVFSEIDPQTINIEPKEIEKHINSQTKAIIPVHFAGNPCELEEIQSIAQQHGLIVIEDACHALGAEYKGSKIGSCKYSDMTVLSFHAVKHITTGEGGIVLTNNKDYYAEEYGAGEILLNSIDRDGSKKGYDLDLIRQVVEAVNIPVIVCGGVSHPKHFLEAMKLDVSAVAAANFFHYTEHSVVAVKQFLKAAQADIRLDSYATYNNFNFDQLGRVQKLEDPVLEKLRFEYIPEEVI